MSALTPTRVRLRQAHLMSLDRNIEAFNSLKKLERIFIKENIEESQSKQTDITKKIPVNQHLDHTYLQP
jgi:hypothetical protein